MNRLRGCVLAVVCLAMAVGFVGCAKGAGGSAPSPVIDGSQIDTGAPLMGDDDDDQDGGEDEDAKIADDAEGEDDAEVEDDTDVSEPDADVTPDADVEDDAEPVGCTSAADCSDGDVCNGTERCVAGMCRAGTPVVCDDDLDCTVDSCAGGECFFEPDDTLCADTETCDADTGCVDGCAESPCRLTAPQCGCGDGQGCYFGTGDTRFCATAGTLAEGTTCSATTACSAGMMCLNISASGRNAMCMRFCDGDRDCSGAGSACALQLSTSGGDDAVEGVKLCTRACNPVSNDGCPSGASCTVYGREGGGGFITDCSAPSGTGGQGASCESDEDCQAGFGCIDADGDDPDPAMCLRWCRTGTSCSTGECTGFNPPLLLAGTEYGACS